MALQGRRKVHVRKGETMKVIGNGKWRIAACIASAVVLAFACIALANCSAESGTHDNGAPVSERSAETRFAASAEAPSGASESENETESTPVDAAEPQSGQFADLPGKTTSQDAVSDDSGSDSQTNSSTEEAPPTSAPAASGGESQKQPVWVVDYEEIWVEDSPEWDESVPVYGYTEVSVCNICGADVTGNTAPHAKQHMLAGEGSGHHSEVREVVTGYEMVHHDAEGHWERAESGGHWE